MNPISSNSSPTRPDLAVLTYGEVPTVSIGSLTLSLCAPTRQGLLKQATMSLQHHGFKPASNEWTRISYGRRTLFAVRPFLPAAASTTMSALVDGDELDPEFPEPEFNVVELPEREPEVWADEDEVHIDLSDESPAFRALVMQRLEEREIVHSCRVKEDGSVVLEFFYGDAAQVDAVCDEVEGQLSIGRQAQFVSAV